MTSRVRGCGPDDRRAVVLGAAGDRPVAHAYAGPGTDPGAGV